MCFSNFKNRTCDSESWTMLTRGDRMRPLPGGQGGDPCRHEALFAGVWGYASPVKFSKYSETDTISHLTVTIPRVYNVASCTSTEKVV